MILDIYWDSERVDVISIQKSYSSDLSPSNVLSPNVTRVSFTKHT